MSPPSNKTLAGKVALVTGSSRGIGAAIATRLAEHGANLVVNYVASAGAAEQVVENIRGLGVKAIAVKADVSNNDELAAMFQKAKSEFGRLDIVMSNSGIEHFGSLDQIKPEEIDKVLAVNVKAQLLVAQQAYKHLEDHGRLILISSVSAIMGIPNHPLYATSKAAIIGMTRCLAWDFGKRNITVNCVAPGGIKTDMFAEVAKNYFPDGSSMTMEEIDTRASQFSPLGRPGFPNDIAGAVAIISSSEAQWITGQTFYVSGGAQVA